jgi:hypothetical protein
MRQAPPAAALEAVATIPLPAVSGRIDHLAFDAAREHLFVAALGNNSVEVVDAATNRHLRSLTGFHEPQGVAVLADVNAVAIANGDTGTLQLIDAVTCKRAGRWRSAVMPTMCDTTSPRSASTSRRSAVCSPWIRQRRLNPEDRHRGSSRIVPVGIRRDARLCKPAGLLSSQIVAGDRKTMSVTARWSPGCGGNYPMAWTKRPHECLSGVEGRRPWRRWTPAPVR